MTPELETGLDRRVTKAKDELARDRRSPNDASSVEYESDTCTRQPFAILFQLSVSHGQRENVGSPASSK